MSTAGTAVRRFPGGLFILGLIFVGYLLTGFFQVPANEVAVVRRFGRPVWPLRASGLQYDLPWPFSRVDRVNLNAIRTLTFGEAAEESQGFLAAASDRSTTFLTGDRNVLQIRITVQYRISEEFLAEWLYSTELPEQRLQALVESKVADLVSRCGVDFVHTQGLSELNNRLLLSVRDSTRNQRLGCEVEQVTVDRAEPPARVKADFLDVSNARADMTRSVNEARVYAEQKMSESQADARQLVDQAGQERSARISAAKGSADRFTKLIGQIQQDTESGTRHYALSRYLTVKRLYVETVRELLGRVKSKVVLDGPTDVVLPKNP